jgi:hypothetical protein
VFVDRSDGIFDYPYPVDIPAYMSAEPAFKEAWSRYRYDSTIDNCETTDAAPKKQESQRAVKQVHIDCRYDIYLPAEGQLHDPR